MGLLEDNSDLIQDDSRSCAGDVTSGYYRLINCATAKLQKDCGTIHGCNYKYGSHGELKAYFRLVWTPNFIELVIKQQDANLKKKLANKKWVACESE